MSGRPRRERRSFIVPGRLNREWSAASVEYAWLPPFEGAALTKPNRLEVVFTAHDRVVLEQGGKHFDVKVQPGSMYVVGDEPTTLHRVAEFSDTLEIYPSADLLGQCSGRSGQGSIELQPSLGREESATFGRSLVMLAVAHRFRRGCLGLEHISDVEGDYLAHLVFSDLLTRQQQGPSRRGPGSVPNGTKKTLFDYIECNLTNRISVGQLAGLAGLSPFHFSRCFRAATGMSPHAYVAARRIEHARRQILSTDIPVAEIAWSIGYENLSHFRRRFAAGVGVLPGELRADVRQAVAGPRKHDLNGALADPPAG